MKQVKLEIDQHLPNHLKTASKTFLKKVPTH